MRGEPAGHGATRTGAGGGWRRWFGPWVDEVGPATLRADALAAVVAALLVLPQAIAFARLAGLPPEMGLATAVLPCIVAALFGSSRHVVTGPTNANSLALAAMLAPLAVSGSGYYVELALAMTVLVGLMQAAIGLLRLGSLANFISPPALLGFTGGAALLIALQALPDLTGLPRSLGQGMPAWMLALPGRVDAALAGPLLVAGATLAVTLPLRRWRPRWPNLLLGLISGTLAAAWVNGPGAARGWPAVETIGTLAAPWPRPHWPQVSLAELTDLLPLAFALTIVALAQSVAIAKAMAARSGQPVDPNREFRGQGLANIAGGLSSCFVACGSLNRSLPNYEAGARTPLAAVFSALLVLALAGAGAALLGRVPLATIAALLLPVAWSLLDLPSWRRLWRLSRSDFAVAAGTLLATVTLRMELAILLGTIASLGLYLHRTAHPAMRRMGFDSMREDRRFVVVDGNADALPPCRELLLLRMEGSVYFGAVAHVAERLQALRDEPDAPPHLLVMAKSMNDIDLAGCELWLGELRARRAMGGDLYFHRPRPPVMEMWEKTGFLRELGPDHVFPDKHTAIAGILSRLGEDPCARCGRRLFHECRRAAPPEAAAAAK